MSFKDEFKAKYEVRTNFFRLGRSYTFICRRCRKQVWSLKRGCSCQK